MHGIKIRSPLPAAPKGDFLFFLMKRLNHLTDLNLSASMLRPRCARFRNVIGLV